MAIFVFVLGLLLTILGFGGLLASVDLLPTEIGMLYAGCGTIAASAGLIVLSIGALIRRIDALGAPRRAPTPEPTPFEAPVMQSPPEPLSEAEFAAPLEMPEPAAAHAEAVGDDRAEDRFEDEPINENRAGRLPTFAEVEHALVEPGAPPTLVGRYTAGGANYMIFSDGTIEAETEQGAFRFASMGEFKAYIARGR
jgi:hypothetical protein